MAMRERVTIVVPGDDPAQIQGSAHLGRLEPYGEVTVYTDRPTSAEEQVRRAREAHILLNSRGAVKWPGELLRQLPRLRMITVFGIGTDSIDLDAARERGIVVCNIPGKTAPVVAEHAFGLMLACAKRAVFQTDELRAGRWGTRVDNVYLHGKTLGVVGVGNIGARMAELGRAIGMRVLAWTYHPSPERAAARSIASVPIPKTVIIRSRGIWRSSSPGHLTAPREFNRTSASRVRSSCSSGLAGRSVYTLTSPYGRNRSR